jgi:Glycosyl transferase family 90
MMSGEGNSSGRRQRKRRHPDQHTKNDEANENNENKGYNGFPRTELESKERWNIHTLIRWPMMKLPNMMRRYDIRGGRFKKSRQCCSLLRLLFLGFLLSSGMVGLGILYRIYRAESNPSPFLPNRYNYLPYRIRGMAPPSHLFEFLTPHERIQFYMGNWYREHINKNPHLYHLNSTIVCNAIDFWQPGMPEIGRPYRFNGRNLHSLIYQGWWKRLPWRPQRSHPGDAYLYHFQLVDTTRINKKQQSRYSEKQMLLQFGDGKDSAKFLSTPYPLMVKTRLSQWVYEERYGNNRSVSVIGDTTTTTPASAVATTHYPPILGMYEMHRHYHDHFYETDDLWEQIPWHTKHNSVIWRGSTSGQRRVIVQQYIDAPVQDIDVAFSEILKVHQGKLAQPDDYYLRNAMSVRELLRYKYLLVLEGWGMASSLKWMLYSNSVVFMAKPTKTSWAMEEKLVPYVHYVPLSQNHSNLPQQLEWARTHDEECRKIALYSRHYMERLVTSPQAQQETTDILIGMDTIYQEQYGAMLQKCPSTTN